MLSALNDAPAHFPEKDDANQSESADIPNTTNDKVDDDAVESSIITQSQDSYQLELEELNDLYDCQDRGEDVDEDRLYELELFDCHRQGEELNNNELDDLAFFKKQRVVFAGFKAEMDEMRALQAAGVAIDGDRMYFLEIADKKRSGIELSPEEAEDMNEFLQIEEEAQIKAADHGEEIKTATSVGGFIGISVQENRTTSKDSIHLGTQNSVQRRFVNASQISHHLFEDENPLDRTQPKIEAAESGNLEHTHSSDQSDHQYTSGPGTLEGTDPVLSVPEQSPILSAPNNAPAHFPEKDDANQSESADIPNTTNDKVDDDAVESSIITQSQDSYQLELEELNDLYDRQDRGEDVDEDRLYELELFDRHRQGEELNNDELDDLAFFKKQRVVFAEFKAELDEMRVLQAAGVAIDGDRMYFLEIADKKRSGIELSPEEAEDMNEFLQIEEEAQVKAADGEAKAIMLDTKELTSSGGGPDEDLRQETMEIDRMHTGDVDAMKEISSARVQDETDHLGSDPSTTNLDREKWSGIEPSPEDNTDLSELLQSTVREKEGIAVKEGSDQKLGNLDHISSDLTPGAFGEGSAKLIDIRLTE